MNNKKHRAFRIFKSSELEYTFKRNEEIYKIIENIQFVLDNYELERAVENELKVIEEQLHDILE